MNTEEGNSCGTKKTVERIRRSWIDASSRRPRAACSRPWRSKMIFPLESALARVYGVACLTARAGLASEKCLGGKVPRGTSIKPLRATGHRQCGCTAHPAVCRLRFHLSMCFIPRCHGLHADVWKVYLWETWLVRSRENRVTVEHNELKPDYHSVRRTLNGQELITGAYVAKNLKRYDHAGRCSRLCRLSFLLSLPQFVFAVLAYT